MGLFIKIINYYKIIREVSKSLYSLVGKKDVIQSGVVLKLGDTSISELLFDTCKGVGAKDAWVDHNGGVNHSLLMYLLGHVDQNWLFHFFLFDLELVLLL